MSAHPNESQNSFHTEDYGLKNTEPQIHASRFMRAIKRDNLSVKSKHINETVDHHLQYQYLHHQQQQQLLQQQQQQHHQLQLSQGSSQEDQKEMQVNLRCQDDIMENAAIITRRAKNIYSDNEHAGRPLLTNQEDALIPPTVEEPCANNKCPNLYRCSRCKKPFTSTNPPYLLLKRDKTTITDEDVCMKSIKIANNTFSAGLAKDNVVRISVQINVTYYFAIIFFFLMLGMFFYYNISDFIKFFRKLGFDYFLKYK